MFTKKEELLVPQAFEMIEADADFAIAPCEKFLDFDDKSKYTKLQINDAQKMQLSALIQHTPQAIAAGTLAQAYTVSFPKGLPHTLTALHQGGYGSMIRANNQFVGSASFYPIHAQAVALGAFTAMSAVTGQYFLSQINSELRIVNEKLDDILNFLYGEKKAELIAEIEFVKYAHKNFNTIMLHEQQRLATIINLQEARKVALKDMEFYFGDLDAISQKGAGDYSKLMILVKDAYKAKECIEMSRQLYVVSGLLELYYSQNYDESYISSTEQGMIEYINRCDNRIVSGLSKIQSKISDYKPQLFERVEDQYKQKEIAKLEKDLESYKDGKESPIRIFLKTALDEINKKAVYYIDKEGQIYLKN
ncbi:MAG: hypothetical protein IKP72_15200 [Clostridia bacterium]|nr:hypothetical protein [Clostridia bacterium]